MNNLARAFTLFLMVFAASSRAEPLQDGMNAVAAKDWDAVRTAMTQGDPTTRDILLWQILRASEGSFAEARAFLARRADWPGLPFLRQNVEETIPASANPANVIAFFRAQAPRTGEGALRLADAEAKTGDETASRAGLKAAYLTLPMTAETRAAVAERLGGLSPQDHFLRAQTFLDQGRASAARAIVAKLSGGEAALVRARIGLQTDTGNPDALIGAVPASLASDVGLAADRFLWRAARGRFEDAVELALATSPQQLRAPERWASWRRSYARRLMREGEIKKAYELATRHGLVDGSNYADLEWLAGYIALQKMGDPERALRHFARHDAAVDTPISKGRAGYWQGRAHDVLGNTAAAGEAYKRAAGHQTSFYGLLAAERIKAPYDPALAGTERHPGWRQAAFVESSVFEAGVLLIAQGYTRLGVRFLTHLSESLSRDEIGQLAEFADELGQPYLQVQIAKRAVQFGHVLERPYFPLHVMIEEDLPVPMELALAIARRESEFFPGAVSGVGAQGLMQVMPGTAEEVADRLGLPYSAQRLTQDADYNLQLGAAYLQTLQGMFGDSPVQVAAAYNAGPSRPRAWMQDYGDPRRREVDVVDWIEGIPFRETRNYVMRVTESLPIYRARLAGQVPEGPVRFTSELVGDAPLHRPALRPEDLGEAQSN